MGTKLDEQARKNGVDAEAGKERGVTRLEDAELADIAGGGLYNPYGGFSDNNPKPQPVPTPAPY